MFSLFTLSSVLLAASSVLAADHVVMVGKDASGASKLVFTPDSLTAAAGDSITFQTFGTHTATISSFAKPCEAMTGSNAFDVGGSPGNFTYNVTAATPTWFYCKTGNHCAAGQVFALNPTAEKTFDAFKATAMGGSAPSSSSNTSSSASPSGSAAPKSAAGRGYELASATVVAVGFLSAVAGAVAVGL